MSSSVAPIGVFDSGVGGLTVLKQLGLAFPNQSWIYLGDTARLPYGTKSGTTIKTYTEENLSFLGDLNCQAFIIACNSASTQFPNNEFKGLPVYKVIKPGAISAYKKTKNGKIGIIGTKATITSTVYELELLNLGFKGLTFTQACPLFVPLVEEGLFDNPITELTIDHYLNPMKLAGIDTLILGCTHYPLLTSALQRYFGPSVILVSSEAELIHSLRQSIKTPETKGINGSIALYTTDRVEFVADLARVILSGIPQSLEFKDLSR